MQCVIDIETYPNLFSVGFKELNKDNYFTFILTEKINQLPKLVTFLTTTENLTLIGHNLLGYDNVMLYAVIEYYKRLTNTRLKRLSDKLIDRDKLKEFRFSEIYKKLKYPERQYWKTYDTMELTRVINSRVSLKHAMVMLRWKKIQDLPFDPNRSLTEDEITKVISYMGNDIYGNEEMFNSLIEMIRIRRDVRKIYNIDVGTENDTGVGKKILDAIYCEKTGINYRKLREMGSPVFEVELKDCIGKNIEFVTPEMQKVKEYIESLIVYKHQRFKYSYEFQFDGTRYKIGIGGLHSQDGLKPGVWRSTKKKTIRDCDIASMYPMIMILNEFFPPHLEPVFIKILREITEERLKAKALGKKGDRYQKSKAASLKITINSIYGLLGNEYYWLYSPKTLISVTISGQLYLLDLIEKLSLVGIHTISANTDGIVCEIPTDMEEIYYQVCKEWEERTGFKLEYTDYKMYARRDVNNYLTEKTNGKTKGKGIFVNYPAFLAQFEQEPKFYGLDVYNDWINGDSIDLEKCRENEKIPVFQKGFSPGGVNPIISIALYQYFVHSIPVMDTLTQHDNILDFCFSQRVDTEKFEVKFGRDNEDISSLQKTNRYIVVKRNKGKSIYKERNSGQRLSMSAKNETMILNDVEDMDPRKYPLDLWWYEKTITDIIDKIDPPQVDLFNLAC